MKNVLMLFALLSFAFLGCSDDAPEVVEDYEVTIKIVSPTPNSTFTAFDDIPLEVSFVRGSDEIIHNVLIELIDENSGDTKVLFEQHVHQTETYTFANETGLTIGDVGSYTLRATSFDPDGNLAEPAEMIFTAQ